MTPHMPRRIKIFISYSHRDAGWLERLRVHLRPLERDFEVDIWDDTKIQGGAKWQEEIERALASAAVAILLVSADFLASDFIAENELPPLLKAAEEEGAVILPVILNHSGFMRHETLSRFQAFNPPSKPLLDMPKGKQAAVLEKVAERVAELLGAPADIRQGKARTRQLRRTKRFVGKRQTERVRGDVAGSLKSGSELGSFNPVHALNDRQSKPTKRRRIGYWLIIATVGLGVLTASILIAVQRSGSRAQSHTLWSQSSPVQPDVVRVTIENGGTARIFNDGLRIHLDGISLDEGSNQYSVSFSLSSPSGEELNMYDVRVMDEGHVTYPANGTLKIRMLSAGANFADFAIEKTEN